MGKPTESNESLTVRDERTGKTYSVPCARLQHFAHLLNTFATRIVNNTIQATAFRDIKAPRKPGEREENETERGLRVADRGFMNTAVIESTITYIDGDNGILRYRCVRLCVYKQVHSRHQRISDRAARRALIVSRSRVPAHLRRAAHRTPIRFVRERSPHT